MAIYWSVVIHNSYHYYRITCNTFCLFPVKNIGTAKAYLFRVFSHSADQYTESKELKYELPENVKNRAVAAGLIGGLLFFLVAIILSVCIVKICKSNIECCVNN